jgi:DNA-binding CsgD family transcriptional regulator
LRISAIATAYAARDLLPKEVAKAKNRHGMKSIMVAGPELGSAAEIVAKQMTEYLTIAEVAERLKIKPKTVANKMASGVFRRGVHYFSPAGLGPRFKWSAVVEWIEQSQKPPTENDDLIPMARGYSLGNGNHLRRPD